MVVMVAIFYQSIIGYFATRNIAHWFISCSILAGLLGVTCIVIMVFIKNIPYSTGYFLCVHFCRWLLSTHNSWLHLILIQIWQPNLTKISLLKIGRCCFVNIAGEIGTSVHDFQNSKPDLLNTLSYPKSNTLCMKSFPRLYWWAFFLLNLNNRWNSAIA